MQIEIIVPAILSLLSLFSNISQLRCVSLWEDRLFSKGLCCPIPALCDDPLLSLLETEPLSKESKRLEIEWLFLVCSCSLDFQFFLYTLWWKKCPTRVEEDVTCELLGSLVLPNIGSMDSDDVSDSLNDGEVFEFLSEHHQRTVIDHTFEIEGGLGICNPHGEHKPVRLKWLVRELCIKDHSIEVILIVCTNLAILQCGVCVLSSLVSFLFLNWL